MGKKNKGKGPADYEVGRGKPPRHTQFPPGRSANPGGRKKGSVNVKTVLKHIADSEIQLTEHGKSRQVTMTEALLLACFKLALSGKQRSIEFLVDKLEALDPQNTTDGVELEQDDRALLDAAMLARQTSMRAAGGSPPRQCSDVDDPVEEDDPEDDDDDGSDEPNGTPPRRSGKAGREGQS